MVSGQIGKGVSDALRRSLNLPKTKFAMRANAVKREPELREKCVSQLYKWQQSARACENAFILHDGPPFANGSLHMGHFLNKVLKDIINRYKVMRGYRIDYIPGWDCHGLPIEHKALEELRSGEKEVLTALEVRKLSQKLAVDASHNQRQEFKSWGILADWSDASSYSTMDKNYEAKQYDILEKMISEGLVYRGLKPVYWSPSSKTALAESELDYVDNHISQSCYVEFPFHSVGSNKRLEDLLPSMEKLTAVVWTTTPWTIPSNLALVVHPLYEYVVIEKPDCNKQYIVAKDLLESFEKENNPNADEDTNFKIIEEFVGKDLEGCVFNHPLSPRYSEVLLGEHVTTDIGTGIVHTAPGHGVDDYNIWMKYGNDSSSILCPIDDSGRFTIDAGEQLKGLDVLNEGNLAVLSALKKKNRLLSSSNYKHRYPYDWRTKKPVILRATNQWFARLKDLHEKARDALEDVNMIPQASWKRLEATLKSREEWCISRQRSWGLPLPVFYHKITGEPLMNSATINHVKELVKLYGSDCWWKLSERELLPESYADISDNYAKGLDTLDVWFDSGSSWYSVLGDLPSYNHQSIHTDKNCKKIKADMYLEGSDQHRGWFQSSLLTSIAFQETSPYRSIITHGFVLDEESKKMSKSLGNVLEPSQFINGGSVSRIQKGKKSKLRIPAYGVDVLRFWVAGVDYTSDVTIGPNVVSKVSDNLRKFRNSIRFLLGNLNDYDPTLHRVPYEDLPTLEKYMLHLLFDFSRTVTRAYEEANFNRAQQLVSRFISSDLSSFYMEASKDTLYCDSKDSNRRRSIQTVLALSLEFLTKAVAPVACHIAEDICSHTNIFNESCDSHVSFSIFQHGWIEAEELWYNPEIFKEWEVIRNIRQEINKISERARKEGLIGSQLEIGIELIPLSPQAINTCNLLNRHHMALDDVFMCSSISIGTEIMNSCMWDHESRECVDDSGFKYSGQFNVISIQESTETIGVIVTRASGNKCPRCWKYSSSVNKNRDTVCSRCSTATGLSRLEDFANHNDS